MSGSPVLSVFLAGIPIPAPRPRAGLAGSRRVYMPPAYMKWKRDASLILRARWGHNEPITLAVSTAIAIVLPRPKKRPRSGLGRLYWHPTEDYPAPIGGRHGDGDNYVKSVWDALQDAGIIKDDSQVVEWNGTKYQGSDPGLHIDLCIVHPEGPDLIP